jgi:Reverse transcriptase (RNA-dependent DNA polymerase).
MISFDVKGAFDSAWQLGIIKNLKDMSCPRNLCNLSQDYFNHREFKEKSQKDHVTVLDTGIPFINY